jgi:hypothetical protein
MSWWRGLAIVLVMSSGLSPELRLGAETRAPVQQAGAANVDLLFEQAKRLFDAFNYPDAVPALDRVITELAASGQSRPDLLVQAYSMRAQSKFAIGESAAAEQDFASLLRLQPDYTFPGTVSARVQKLFDSVKTKTVGQLALTISHPGEIQIDGRSYTIPAEAHILDLPAGDHELTVKRSGFTPVAQRFAIKPADTVVLELKLERVSANLEISTVPGEVEVFIDGKSRGKTPRATGTDPSAPLLVTDVPLGARRLELRRPCYVTLQTSIEVRPEDMRPAPLSLDRAVASVTIQSPEPGALVFVDGGERGKGSTTIEVCEGTRAIEVRGTAGRFVDRRDWKAGATATITATLRRAFPIVVVRTPDSTTADPVRTAVERAMAAAPGVLVYTPPDGDLQAALKSTPLPADFLVSGAQATAAQVSVDGTREAGRRLAGALGVQGLAAIAPGTDAYTFNVSLLASGSGLPDVIPVNTADAAAARRSLDALSVPLPPIVRPAVDMAAIDLSGVQGATVVRVWGASEKAGLAVGDAITSANGAAVASVADLRKVVAAARPGSSLVLDVAGANARAVTVPVSMGVDTIPLRDPSVVYNLALVGLQESARTASSAAEKAASQLNLGIVHIRLRNWDQALSALEGATLPPGAGVSAGTVFYLMGLAYEGAGRAADAQGAFKKAAAVPGARLAVDGPLVAPLAQQKLRAR